MEIPKHLQDLVDRLGHALVQALANDPASRELARDIQVEGYDIALMLEATVALHKREVREPLAGGPLAAAREDFSEADKALLRTFKIALD